MDFLDCLMNKGFKNFSQVTQQGWNQCARQFGFDEYKDANEFRRRMRQPPLNPTETIDLTQEPDSKVARDQPRYQRQLFAPARLRAVDLTTRENPGVSALTPAQVRDLRIQQFEKTLVKRPKGSD